MAIGIVELLNLKFLKLLPPRISHYTKYRWPKLFAQLIKSINHHILLISNIDLTILIVP